MTLFALLACNPTPEVMPFQGPDGVTTLETDNEEVLVGMTHLRVRNAPGPGRRFGDHADAVANHLYDTTPEGWLGASFRNVGKLDWWTLTVWESEEAMLDFILSEPHASAMTDLGDISAAAESRSEWLPVEDGVPSWETVLEKLETDPDFMFVR